MNEFGLQNQNGDVLVSKAFEIEDDVFIIGRRKNQTELDCNTFPMSEKSIEGAYGLKFIR